MKEKVEKYKREINNNNNTLKQLSRLQLYTVQKITTPKQTDLHQKQNVYTQPKMGNSPSEN